MFQIIFVCHGNICRSPMAESMLAYLAKKQNFPLFVDSAAAHSDNIGDAPHYGTCRILRKYGVPLKEHYARLLTRADGEKFDYIIGMDEYNLWDMKRIIGEKNAHKIRLLLDFTPTPRSVADPWYTGDFEATYRDVSLGCEALLNFLKNAAAQSEQ